MSSLALTYRYAISDIKLSLKISFPDAEITTQSIAFWVITCSNIMRQRHLKVEPTGSYLSEYYGPNAIPVNTDGIKKWIVLPTAIYDLMNEKGIDYISLNLPGIPFGKQIRFTQTDAQIIDQLYLNLYELPKPSNPYFYRVGQNIFLLGIETVTVVNVNLGIYGSLDPRPVLLSEDSPLGINEEQYPALKDMVLNLGRFVLVVPSNRMEVGDDERSDNARQFAKNQAAAQPQNTEE